MSAAANLVPGDTNAEIDVFARVVFHRPERQSALSLAADPSQPFRPLAPSLTAQMDDLEVLRQLRGLFARQPAGQRLIELYYEHAAETGAPALADPDLMWDAYLTLQNFLPGLAASLSGRGDEMVITQAMVDQANAIADRLAAAGSPPLAAERAAHNQLQDFVGLSFDEALAALGVSPPGQALYLPVVGRP